MRTPPRPEGFVVGSVFFRNHDLRYAVRLVSFSELHRRSASFLRSASLSAACIGYAHDGVIRASSSPVSFARRGTRQCSLARSPPTHAACHPSSNAQPSDPSTGNSISTNYPLRLQTIRQGVRRRTPRRDRARPFRSLIKIPRRRTLQHRQYSACGYPWVKAAAMVHPRFAEWPTAPVAHRGGHYPAASGDSGECSRVAMCAVNAPRRICPALPNVRPGPLACH